jgi:type I restriction enzyme S subunit
MKNLPKGWKYVPLGDILTMTQYGLSMPSSDQGQYPMFRMNNFRDGKVVAENLVYVDLPDKEAAKFLLQPNDILFNRTNSQALVGKTGLFNTPGDYVFASYLVRLRVDEEVADPRFVNYFLNDDKTKQELKALSTAGVSQSNINPTTLRERLMLPLPPLPEQLKIATILNACDQVIDGTTLLLKKQEKLKTALTNELLHLNSLTIPKGWTTCEISSVAEINPRKPKAAAKELVSFVGMADVSEEMRLTNHTSRPYSEVANGFTGFQDNDILIAKITPCFENGKGAFVTGLTNGKGFGSTEFHVVRAEDNTVKRLLYHHFSSYKFRVRGEANMTGSAGQKRIPASFIGEYSISIPPKAELQKIVGLLDAANKQLDMIRQKLRLLKKQKKGLMQHLLTGQSFTH